MTSIESFLISSEDKIKLFFNAIPMPTYVWQKVDDSFTLIDFNYAAIEDTNGNIKNFVGMKASDYYKENPLVVEDINKCLREKRCSTREVKGVSKTPAIDRYLSLKYGYIPPDLILVCAEDVTEKKLVETVLKKTQRTLKRSNKVLRRTIEDRTQKLKESEKQYQLISENAKDILIMTNKKYEPEYVNEKALKDLLGYSKEDVIGLSGLEFIHPDDIPKALHSVKIGIEEGQGVAEIRYRHKKGHYVWMEAAGKTFRDDNNKLKGIVVLRDIAKRKSLEAKLIDSEQKYRLISENAHDLIGVVNQKFKYEYLNEHALFNILGYSTKEVVGKNILKYIHPEDVELTVQQSNLGFSSGIATGEIRAKHKQGYYVWLDLNGKVFIDHHGNKKAVIISRDITNRKLLEEKLKDSEEKYRLISENAQDILILTNEKYEIEYINKIALKKLLGYSDEEVIGCVGLAFIHHDDLKKTINALKKGSEEGEGLIEIRARHKKGHYIWIEATGKTFKDDFGSLKGIIILRDITKRKSFELKLKESEENYRLITEESNDLIRVLNDKFEIEFVNNNTLQNFIGYARKELQGKNTLFLNHPDDYTEVRRFMLKVFKDGENMHETRIKHKNGRWVWVENKVKMFTDERGNQKYLLISRDISERKIIEKALLESEEKYRHLFEKSPYMIIIINYKGDIVDFNQNTFNYLRGIERSDLINKNFLELDFIPIEHMNKLKGIYKEVFKKGYSDPLEFKMDSSKKNLVGTSLAWIEIQTAKVKVGEEDLIQVIIRDISKRKEGEEQIKDQEEMFRKFFEESRDGVLLTNESGYISKWNRGQEEIFGIRKKEIIGSPVWDAFFTQIPEKYKSTKRYRFLQSTIENFFKTGKASWLNQLQEIDIHKPDGTYQCIQQLPFSIKTKKGYMLGSVNRDITERKLAEQKLKESEKKYRSAYEQANFYKNLFAHDISNILSIIDWSSQLCSNYFLKQDKLEDLEENLDRIKEQTNRAKKLINNIQKLTELDDAKMVLKPIEICTILKDCVNYIYDSFKEKKIEIEIKASEKKYSVYANELLADVFENIFNNGINHNLNIEIKFLVKLSLEQTKQGQFIKIEFSDNGIGIPDERKEIIFQKGLKKDKHTKGMGFGLTLVKKIIESYEGDIWIEDRIPGDYTQGSVFVILLPLIKK